MPKYSLENEDNTIYKGGTLPELVVTPADWQIDYMNNFGNKELRRDIYNSIYRFKLANLEKYYGNISKGLSKNAPFFIRSNPDLKAAYTEKINNDLIDEMSATSDEDFTNVVHRLYNVWNASGRPTISNDKSIVNYTYKRNEKRPNYSPVSNKVYRADAINDVISELAHPIQIKQGNRNQWYNYLKDGAYNLFNEIRNNRSHYKNKDNYEYETHSVIEPELRNYIYEGVPTNYVKRNGGRISLTNV